MGMGVERQSYATRLNLYHKTLLVTLLQKYHCYSHKIIEYFTTWWFGLTPPGGWPIDQFTPTSRVIKKPTIWVKLTGVQLAESTKAVKFCG